MKFFPVLTLLLLPGCATVYDLDNRMPDARYVSQKPVAALTQCIGAGMRRFGNVQVEDRLSVNVTNITLTTQTGNPAARVTIGATRTGSLVLARQTINYSLGPVIQRCL